MNGNRAFWIAAAVVGALTLIRVAVLFASPLNLYPDEAQYWFWSLTPDWGYYSKPPLIAWLIHATTSVCGDGEACIRVASPLLHGATALMLFGVAKLLYDARVGMWSAIAYITVPGVSFSSGLISTDVPLLFFWTVALYAFIRAAREGGKAGYAWAALCGIALGFGLLSKYAMLYFLPGAALAAFFVPDTRRLILSPRVLLILVIAAVILAPNVAWNAAHNFVTVGKTAANANWEHGGFRPLGSLEFFGGQFGVFGPLMLAAYLFGLWRIATKKDVTPSGRLLACFSFPPLIVLIVQAAISTAYANWAVTAYIAATPLAVVTLMDIAKGYALTLSVAFNALVAAAVMVFAVSPAAAAHAGFANAYKRLQGWRELGQAITQDAAAGGYQAIVSDNRSVMASLLYYTRGRNVPLLIWDRDPAVVANHFEMTMPLTTATRGRVLLVTDRDDPQLVLNTFAHARLTRDVAVDLGGGKQRITHLYEADGYRGPSVEGGDQSPSE